MSQHFVVVAWDAPGSDAARQEKMQAHLAHFGTIKDRIEVAGPMKNAEGQSAGSLLVVRAENEGEARALLEADPYHAAGVWSKIDVYGFKAALGQWVAAKG